MSDRKTRAKSKTKAKVSKTGSAKKSGKKEDAEPKTTKAAPKRPNPYFQRFGDVSGLNLAKCTKYIGLLLSTCIAMVPV